MKKAIYYVAIVLLLNPLNFVHGEDKTSKQVREDSKIHLGVSDALSSFPFPGFRGYQASYNIDSDWRVGVEYSSSGIDFGFYDFELASFEETNLTFASTHFFGNSFYLNWGYSKRSSNIEFDPTFYDFQILEEAENVSESETDMLFLSLGNEWHWKRLSIGADWVRINVPLNGNTIESAEKYTTNPEDQELIADAESILRWYPSVSFAVFKLGYSF